MDHDYTLVLDFPPSANTYYRTWRGRVLISKPGRDYRQHVVNAVACQDLVTLTGRLRVSIRLQAPTRRKYDIDNRIKCLLDAIEHAGVYANDEAIDELTVVRGPVIRDGMCTVYIAVIGETITN